MSKHWGAHQRKPLRYKKNFTPHRTGAQFLRKTPTSFPLWKPRLWHSEQLTERFLMTYIKTSAGTILTDEALIHEMVTKHSNDWFAIPDYAKTSSLHISPTWYTAVDSVDAFLEATETSGEPADLYRKLYPSLRHDAYPRANAELRATFAVPPTIEEFTYAIASLRD